MSMDDVFGVAVTVFVVALLALEIFGGIFVGNDIAEETMKNNGFSDIKIIEKQWFFVGFRGCAGGDNAKFIVKAINSRNQPVELYVCAGWPFKGATIRSKL